MSEYALEGCRITPISNYLKALGLFRILSKKDPKILACWKNDSLVIESEINKEGMVEYLLNEYEPSPIITPWSYNKFEKTCVNLQKLMKDNRFNSYKETINSISIVIEIFCAIHNIKKPLSKLDINDKTKLDFLRLCRNHFPDDAVLWLDAVCVIGIDKPKFAPILGTGANDGNFDMADNFVECIKKIFLEKNESKEWLESALFGNTTKLDKISIIGYNPDGSGGPNSEVGFEGKSLSNPWDYVLMMEGMMLFAGSLSKHLSANAGNKAVFPFTADASGVGYSTSSVEESLEKNYSRGELWLPVWKNPARYNEIKHVFNEGRIQLGGKHAKTGTEFARAIITFGAERGISKFQRFCILKRKGKAYLFTNAGTLYVKDEPVAYLLDELDEWYYAIIKKNKEKSAAKSTIHLARNLDESIMRFCTYRKKQNLLQILIAVGKLERHTFTLNNFKSIQKLSDGWLVECYDGSAEFRLAASVASIKRMNGVGSIRENLENIKQTNKGWEHKKSISFVWKEDDNLLRNMSRILQRRSIDGKINSCDNIPIQAFIPAKINDVFEFLNGTLDIRKISDLIFPLSIIHMTSETTYPWQKDLREDSSLPLPEAYIIMKLICTPNGNKNIPYDTSVLNLLSAGRIDDAYAKASYILHAHGLSPLTYSKKTGNAKSTSVSDMVKEHLMASLLFPISGEDIRYMLKSAIMQPNVELT